MTAARSARELALTALREWRGGQRFADAILHDLLAQSALGSSDRAFATELFYGMLRHLRLLDFWIQQLRRDALDAATRDLVRLGFLQLLILALPSHAALFETVELAPARSRGVVNAMLRSAQRKAQQLQAAADAAPLAIQTSHPDFLVTLWTRQFGQKSTRQLCQWNNQAPPTYLRVNELKMSRAQFMDCHPTARSAAHPLFFEFAELPAEALQRGECYVQDLSTALACELLAPRQGENVLDACAAPGGKTAYLAQLMRNSGSIIATDRTPQRVALLRSNLARLGVANTRCLTLDWTRAPQIDQRFDRVLIDAPCSNSGVMRRRVDVRWRLRPDEFRQMQREQLALARAVLPAVKPGGFLVYSTCSIAPEENEEVVEQLMRSEPDLQLEESRLLLPFRDQTDGAFAARLRRAG